MVIFLFSFFSVNAITDNHNINIVLISQNPDPVSPGEVFDLRFRVENLGANVADNVVLEFVEDFPFSVYSGDKEKNIGSLQGLQRDNHGVIVLFKVKVDEDAVEKVHKVDLRYKVGRGSWITVRDFPIRIRTRDTFLSVESVKSNPEFVSPGEDFELSFTLRNNAHSLIRDITVDLGLSDDSIPFAPSGSTSKQQIHQINSNSGRIMRFNLVALPRAEGGIYKIPISLSYTDESGESYSKNDIISLKVSSSPDILILVDRSDIKKGVKEGDVLFRIVNRGLTDIRLVSSKVHSSDDFEILSNSEIYIGNIDFDDYEIAEYSLRILSYDQFVTVPFELFYRDSTNKVYSEKFYLQLNTHSISRFEEVVSYVFRLLFWVFLVLILLFVVRWYRKRKVKRKG